MQRRDFLAATLALGAGVPAAWLGYRHLNRPPSIRLNKVGLPLAHLLRDGALHQAPQSQHRCRVLILGGGVAGLSAAWQLARRGRRDFVLAEGFERNGNAAAFHAGADLTAPTGAHYLAQPSAESTAVRDMLADLGIMAQNGAQPRYRDTDLVHAPAERLWYRGQWHDGLLPDNPDSRRFLRLVAKLKQARGADGRKAFAIPIVESSADEAWRRLDTDTFAAWLGRNRFKHPDLLHYLDYCCRDDYGQGIARVSAFAGLHYFAARANPNDAVLTWQDGLNHLAEKLRRRIGLRELPHFPAGTHWHGNPPAACAAVALAVREHERGVTVTLRHTASGQTVAVEAERVVCAMPLLMAARIIAGAPHYGFGSALPEYAPWLVGNFVLHRFPQETGKSELAWDNVVHGSSGLGYVVATHQLIRAAKPAHTVFTAYRAMNGDTPANMRRRLLDADAQALIEPAAADLLTVYGKAFWQCVSHIDLTVRAHAMTVPQPGYLHRADLSALRAHRSRIVFAHSDLSGYSVFEEAAYWGVRAADAVLDSL